MRPLPAPSPARPGPSRVLLRASALLAATALAVTGCSGSGGSDGSSGTSKDTARDTGAGAGMSPTPTGTPSASVSVVDGTRVTAPGTHMAFGDTAAVPYHAGKQGTVLDLTVKSVAQGTLADFQGFDMSDPYKHKGSYYYVRVAVRNAGKGVLGGVPVPLWGISDKGRLLRAVNFTSAFAKCPTEPLPKDFKPKDQFDTCLVYLSPNHGGLEGVSYRPTVDYQSIEWHGKVQRPATPSKGKGTNG